MNTALATLPAEWQQWVIDNLARACEPASMAKVMVRDGGFDRMLADAAIEEARRTSAAVQLERKPTPHVDTTSNTIVTPDRVVNVLFTLNAPRVVLLGSVLSDEECDALVAYTEQRLMRSPVVANDNGSTEVHADRTSRSAMMQRGETALIARIDARLAAIAQWPVEQAEGLQVVRYETGNEYRAHYDWFDPAMPGPAKHLEHGGQRVGTFVLYLNDVEQGGGTAFPNCGLEVQPRKGNAIYFTNTDAYGRPDRNTLHAGMPVAKGVKLIANKWLRERAY